MAEFNTLEEARAEIIRQQGVITELTNERDTLSQNNASQAEELEKVRNLNQQYFNQLCAQSITAEDKKDDEEEVPSCVELAKSIKI